MIPKSGPLHELNHTAAYEIPTSAPNAVPLAPKVSYVAPQDGTPATPAVIVGGIPVHVYADADGCLNVSVHIEGEVSEHLCRGRGEEDEVGITIRVNGRAVFMA